MLRDVRTDKREDSDREGPRRKLPGRLSNKGEAGVGAGLAGSGLDRPPCVSMGFVSTISTLNSFAVFGIAAFGITVVEGSVSG